MPSLDSANNPLHWQQRPSLFNPSKVNLPNATWSRPRRIGIIALLLFLLALAYGGYDGTVAWGRAASERRGIPLTKQSSSATSVFPKPKGLALVPLEAHIMSKCPDARDCLRDLIVPAMERVNDKVDFRLSYIGTYVIPFPHFLYPEISLYIYAPANLEWLHVSAI